MTKKTNPECCGGAHRATVDYESGQVTSGFDLRGLVSQERVKYLVTLIQSLVGSNFKSARLLDAGCGTGRFAIPLACSLERFRIFGSDISASMLEQARQKPCSKNVDWLVNDICRQAFADNSFSVIFISDVLHHLEDPVGALRECFRVLHPGGWLLSKYGAMENIENDPEHAFFAGANEIDAERTPTKGDMTRWLKSAGFERITSENEQERTRADARSRLEAARAKSISVLHLIKPADFEDGLQQLAEYIKGNPDDPWLLQDITTFTCGRKPS